MKKDLNQIEISTVNGSVQLRIVQPEHGGGSCNCWRTDKEAGSERYQQQCQ